MKPIEILVLDGRTVRFVTVDGILLSTLMCTRKLEGTDYHILQYVNPLGSDPMQIVIQFEDD